MIDPRSAPPASTAAARAPSWSASARRSFVYAAWVAAPTLLLTLAAKAHKLELLAQAGQANAAPATWADRWLGLRADAVFAVAVGATLWALAALPPGWPRRFGLSAGHLLLGVIGIVAAVEHGFFLSTGSPLDLPMVGYTLQNVAMLQEILASEVDAGLVAGFVALSTLSVWPLALASCRFHLARADAQPPPAAGALSLVASATASAFGLVAALPALTTSTRAALPGRLAVVAEAPVPTLLGGAPTLWAADPLAKVALEGRPAAPLVVARTARSRDWNVVLVALESVRASATTAYAPTLGTTPFLAGVAARGVRVERAYTAVPHTTKSLVPIHCGYYPRVAPGYDEAHAGALPTECLAGTLARLGWATAYFQTSEDVFEKNYQLIKNFGYQHGVALAQLEAQRADKTFDEIGYFGLEDRAMIGPVLSWIDGLRGQPFAFGLVTLASHHPYDVPDSWKRQDFDVPGKRNDYYNAIAATDAALAELHAGLRARGLLDRTIFVYIGDHGEGFGEHGLHQHDEVLYEEGVRVPLLIEAPGLGPRVVGGLRQNIDVVPTVFDLLGLELLAGQLDGKSLLSTAGHERVPLGCWHKDRCLAEIEASPPPRGAGASSGPSAEGGLRKVIDYHDRRPPEVFDLRRDPEERVDLVHSGAVRAADVAPAVARMRAWKDMTLQRFSGQDARRAETLVRRGRPEDLDPARVLDIRFGDGERDVLRLLDVSFEARAVSVASFTHVRLRYEVLAPMPAGYAPFLHGVSRGALVMRSSWIPAEGSHPLAEWQPGEVITDRVHVRPEPGTAIGPFDVLLGFWRPEGEGRLAIRGKGLPLTGEGRILLGTLHIDNPDKPMRPDPQRHVEVQGLAGLSRTPPTEPQPLDVAFLQPPAALPEPLTPAAAAQSSLPVLRVRRVALEGPACAGQRHVLRLRLQVDRRPPRYSRIFTHLRGPGGRHRNLEFEPLEGRLPVDDLRAGDVVDTDREFVLPADWPSGPTDVIVGAYGPNVVGPRSRMPVAPIGLSDSGDQARVFRFEVGACPQ